MWSKVSSKEKKQIIDISGKSWFGEKSVDKQWDFNGNLLEVNKIQPSFYLGHHAPLYHNWLKGKQKFPYSCFPDDWQISDDKDDICSQLA